MCEANEAIALGISPCEHGTSAGATYRAGGEIVGEFDTVFGYGINGRCVNRFDPITAEMTTGVVGGYDDDIWHVKSSDRESRNLG